MPYTVQQLKAKNPQYESYFPEFKKFREAYSGGKDFKNTTHVRRFYSDRPEDYENILGITPTTNICKNLIENRVNTVFAVEPQRNLFFAQGASFLDVENTPGLRSFLTDCTFTGQSFTDFMEEVATQASIYGHCWIYIDKPNELEINVDNPDENRPYLQMITPQQVIDWVYAYIGGKQVLSYIKIIVSEDKDSTTYLVGKLGYGTTRTTLEMYRVDKDEILKDDTLVEEISVVELPEGMGIPCVKSFAKKDPSTQTFGISDIRDAIYFQRFLINLDREAYESIIFKKSILKLPSEVETPEGGGLGIVRGDVEELEAVDFAVPDTADVDSVRSYIDNVLERYSKMCGMSTQTGTQARSGESFYQERQDLYRAATQKSRNLEITETMIFDIFGHWQLLSFAGMIEYDTNYSERDVEMKLHNLDKAREINKEIQSELVNRVIERELVALIGNQEDLASLGVQTDEYKPVKSENPSDFPTEEVQYNTSEQRGQVPYSIRNNGTFSERDQVQGTRARDQYIVTP